MCAPGDGQSVGRYPDSNSTIERFAIHTRGVSNNSAELEPCPIPTPTPKTTPKSTKKTTPTVKEDSEDTNKDSFEVLGLRDQLAITPTSSQKENEQEGNFPYAAVVFILAGASFIGAAAYPFLKKRKKKYNLDNAEKEKISL